MGVNSIDFKVKCKHALSQVVIRSIPGIVTHETNKQFNSFKTKSFSTNQLVIGQVIFGLG